MHSWKPLRLLVPLGLCLAIAACEGTVDRRGYRVSERDVEQIQIGISTEEDVLTLMGTPTTRGTFDEKVWYYIGSELEQWGFLEADLIARDIIEVHFDDAGYVAAIGIHGAEIAQDVDPVDRETPTRGNRVTFVDQLLGNLGRFNK